MQNNISALKKCNSLLNCITQLLLNKVTALHALVALNAVFVFLKNIYCLGYNPELHGCTPSSEMWLILVIFDLLLKDNLYFILHMTQNLIILAALHKQIKPSTASHN